MPTSTPMATTIAPTTTRTIVVAASTTLGDAVGGRLMVFAMLDLVALLEADQLGVQFTHRDGFDLGCDRRDH